MLEPGRFTSSRFGGRSGGGDTLPRLTVSTSPDPIVEDQEVTLTFNQEPDTVAVTLNGGAVSVAGSGLTRTLTPNDAGTLNIQATKADYQPVNANRTVEAAAPTISMTSSPDPIVANEPFTLTFTPAVDSADSSVPLTGSGTTWTGTAPASGPMAITATKAGYQPFEVSRTVDTAVITPNEAISVVQLYETQTVGNIPNFATINSTSYFTRTGRTIASVQAKVGQMVSPGAGQPAVLSNLVNVTGATVLNTGDVVVIDVTDSGGTMRRFNLAETQYMVRITQVNGEVLIDINDLVPDTEVFPYTDEFGTINLTRAMMADGEENYVLPTLTGTAEVGATLTGAAGKWLYDPDLPVPSKTHTITQDGTVVHTFTPGDPLTYVVPSGGDGKAYRLVEGVGGSTAQSAAINVPVSAVMPINLGRLESDKGSNTSAAHAMGNVTIPATTTGCVVVRGIFGADPFAETGGATITIGGVTVPIVVEGVGAYSSTFVARVSRSNLSAGVQPVSITSGGVSRFCVASVDYLSDGGTLGPWQRRTSNGATVTSQDLSLETAADSWTLAVFGEWRQSGTRTVPTWTGLTKEARYEKTGASSKLFTVEFACHKSVTGETSRTMSVSNINGDGANSGQISIASHVWKA